jgi:putative flippase GtrA
MQTSRKEMRGGRGFTVPLFGIAVLLGCYWLLVEWQHLPAFISSVLSAVHWTH